MRTNSDWENVAYMVLLILVVVFVFDNISNFLRKQLDQLAAGSLARRLTNIRLEMLPAAGSAL